MAKQLVRSYAFTPGGAGAGTIELQGRYDLGQLLVITNVTRNVMLYNFADSSYAGTTVSLSRANSTAFSKALQTSDGTTLISLAVSTAGMSSTDNIQVFVERNEVITRPWAMGTDAFERTRVANPQSMLDADFEYGLQPTKWQMIDLNRGAPAVYEIPGTDLTITSIQTDASRLNDDNIESLITVVTQNPHGLSTGSVVTVQNLDSAVVGYARAAGVMLVNPVTATNVFSYYAKAKVGTTTGTNLLTSYTVVRKGGFYTNSGQTPTFTFAGSGATTTATVTLTFAQNHGFLPGDGILVVVSSDNGSNNHAFARGSFYIASVPSPTTLTYMARDEGAITGTILGTVYARADAFYQHRPFDGGVSLGAGGPNYGSMAIRMSKKYIRYQSGKAVNYNTAALFAPNYDIRSVTATNTIIGSTIYVATDELDHGLQAGAIVMLNNVTSQGYNGTYTVASVISERVIALTSTNFLSTTTAVLGVPCQLNHVGWHGATVRSGTFDDQNGIFWQYDGQRMAVGLRSSTFQLSGNVRVTPGSNRIEGNNSRFREQLAAGDRVVVKGMSHVVTEVTSATWIYVNPPYRGSTSTSAAKMVKTLETIVNQNEWNYDRCDGSNGPFNPSGYNLLPYKLQMIGLQWTWYGAGFIDWMLRGADGNYMTVHRMKQSNINFEAYMRSGNTPVRYEVQNEGARAVLVSGIDASSTATTLTDITNFPNSGIIYVDNEMISYTSKSTSTGQGSLLGLSRSAPLSYYINGSLKSFTAGSAASHDQGTGALLCSITATPTISHWGSAMLTDGGFDTDRGYIFNYQATNVVVSTRKTSAFAIRLAPSVSNAIVGDLGVRDLINRAQLLLQGIEITAGGSASSATAIVVEGVINPSNYPSNPDAITWYTLQGTPTGGSPIGTGQPSFSQIATANSIAFDNTATITTTMSAAAAGLRTLTIASTASIAIGDVMVNNTRPNSIQGNSTVLSIGAGTVTISLPTVTATQNTDSVSFFRNMWAQPGETVFSFISSPQSKDVLDLSQLKELTNTPLGGRGCYPNGPDVLFINVYLTQGSPFNTNLILRWGEAQA